LARRAATAAVVRVGEHVDAGRAAFLRRRRLANRGFDRRVDGRVLWRHHVGKHVRHSRDVTLDGVARGVADRDSVTRPIRDRVAWSGAVGGCRIFRREAGAIDERRSVAEGCRSIAERGRPVDERGRPVEQDHGTHLRGLEFRAPAP